MSKTLGQIAYEAHQPHAPWEYVRPVEKASWQDIADAIAAAVQPKWLPISTAPIDTPVLVVWCGVVQNAIVELSSDGAWAESAGDDPWDDFYPTHWMPLPPAPKEEEK